MISLLKPRMSVNNKDIIRMYLGYNWLITQKARSTNKCFLCDQYAMASGNVHLSKLLWSLTIYSFDFFLG